MEYEIGRSFDQIFSVVGRENLMVIEVTNKVSSMICRSKRNNNRWNIVNQL